MGNAWSSRRGLMSRPQVCQKKPEPEPPGPGWIVTEFLCSVFGEGTTIDFEEVAYNRILLLRDDVEFHKWRGEFEDGNRLMTITIDSSLGMPDIFGSFNVRINLELKWEVTGQTDWWEDEDNFILPDCPLEEDVGEGSGSIEVPPT